MNLVKKRNIIIAVLAILIILFLSIFFAVNYLAYRFYPLEYEKEIKNNSTQYSLKPAQVSAIIYEESKFDPDVVSTQDAIGLMQILPDTANLLAKELGIDRLLRDDLFIPDVNIKFGSYYFRQLLDKYNGDVDLALAAYNAGFGTVDKVDKNINNLPRETKDFIRKTKTTERVYITLYPDKLEVSKEDLEKNHLSFFELAQIVFKKIPNKNKN
ncbi:MAG: lytic transglycosylase domain-containing protein [Candidatus Berkelbacteria bacterium]|nr:lytic transglycosylase domain-containing protein [Candidatus Berkelbacteria bacterium]